VFLSSLAGSLSPHWKGTRSRSRTQISDTFSDRVKSLVSRKLQGNFQSSVLRWTSKDQNQKMRMHADELQRLKKRQINTPTSSPCCRTKSHMSPQTLGVL
jgi:hypothetical protein